MSTAEDVMRLYSRFGGDPSTYQEVVMERQVGLAAGKWAMLGQVDLSVASEVPLVQRRLHPLPVQRSLIAAVEQVLAPEPENLARSAVPATPRVAPTVATPTPEPIPQAMPIAEADVVLEQPTPTVVASVPPPVSAELPSVSGEQPPVQQPVNTGPAQRVSSRVASTASARVSPVAKDFGKQPQAATMQGPPSPVLSFAAMGTHPAAPAVPAPAYDTEHVAPLPPQRASLPSTTKQEVARAPVVVPTAQPKRARPRAAPAVVAPVVHDESTLTGVFSRLASQTNSHPTKKGVLRKRFDT